MCFDLLFKSLVISGSGILENQIINPLIDDVCCIEQIPNTALHTLYKMSQGILGLNASIKLKNII